jgi:ribosomal-protein-alanine acetyltransferase
MEIRRFTPRDLSAIIQIQRQVLPVGGWSESDYLRLTQQPGGLALLAETGDGLSKTIAGFAVALHTYVEAEILTLAISSAHQRQGIGRLLLRSTCSELRGVGVRRVFLEVRASNQAAINLYRSTGFVLTYIRRNYYVQPDEDAHVMSLEIAHASSGRNEWRTEESRTFG